jgi:ubiquinone/menaquinone biosynthesis C-methylase UbiE
LNPAGSFKNIDTFIPKEAVLEALKAELRNFQGVLLDIGCGRKPYRSLLLNPPGRISSYIGLDLNDEMRHPAYADADPPELKWDGEKIPLDKDSVDCAIATEVLHLCANKEHLLAETLRVLKPGGLFFFTVPFLWAIHDVPNDQGRPTPFALQRSLIFAGFTDIRMKVFGGWDASLAQMLGLWVGRRPMSQLKRRILKIIFLPIMKTLLREDHRRPPKPDFEGTLMITGTAGTARKPGSAP